MLISADLRQVYFQRTQALEASIRHLAAEILQHLPADIRPRLRRTMSAKVDVLFAELDTAITLKSDGEQALSGVEVDRVHELSDDLIKIRADIDRRKRAALRAAEDTDIEARRLKDEQLRRELAAEFGGED